MFYTIRSRILQAIAVELAKVTYGMARTHAYQPAAFEEGRWPDPSAFIWVEEEAPADDELPMTAIQLESYKATVAVEVWGKGDVEDYLAKVHQAMSLDRSWSGLALDTDRKSSEIYTVDPNGRITGVRTLFNLFYRHYAGDPYSKAGEPPPDIAAYGGMEWVEGGVIEWVEGGVMEGVEP